MTEVTVTLQVAQGHRGVGTSARQDAVRQPNYDSPRPR